VKGGWGKQYKIENQARGSKMCFGGEAHLTGEGGQTVKKRHKKGERKNSGEADLDEFGNRGGMVGKMGTKLRKKKQKRKRRKERD